VFDQRDQLGQHTVTNTVAIVVIDGFEMIQVQQHQRVGLPGLLGVGGCQVQRFVHRTPVLHPSEGINGGQVFQAHPLVLVPVSEHIGTGTDDHCRGGKGPHLHLGAEGLPERHQYQHRGNVQHNGNLRCHQEEGGHQAGIQPEQARLAHHIANRYRTAAGHKGQHHAAHPGVAGQPAVYHSEGNTRKDHRIEQAGHGVALQEPKHGKRRNPQHGTGAEQGNDGQAKIVLQAMQHAEPDPTKVLFGNQE